MQQFTFAANYYVSEFQYGEHIFKVRVCVLETNATYISESVTLTFPHGVLESHSGGLIQKSYYYMREDPIAIEYCKWNVVVSQMLQVHLESIVDSFLENLEKRIAEKRRLKLIQAKHAKKLTYIARKPTLVV